MTTFEWLLILHLVGVFLLVGGSVTVTVLAIARTRTSNTGVIHTLSMLAEIGEYGLIVPGALMAIGFGSWLVSESGYSYGDDWIVSAYVLFGFAFSLGTLVLGPFNRRVGREAKRLADEGVAESEELRKRAGNPIMALLGNLENVIIIAFIYLMVAKPSF